MFGQIQPSKPGRPLVKICGITSEADAWAAIEAGADAIGLNFVTRSRRYLDRARARPWLAALPAALPKIAIVVNPTALEAREIGRLPFITGLQLHGQETPEFCGALAAEAIAFGKALPVIDENSLANAGDFSTQTIVLDSQSAEGFGGTGKKFPWQIAARFVERNRDFRVVLAGGLTPENVADGVRAVRPFAVDVTSGVEARPGQKDHALVRAFIAAVRAC